VTTHDMRYLPYLVPWVRLLFLIRSIRSTEWDEMTGRLVQPILRRALEMRRQIAAGGVVELDASARRLRTALAAGLIPAHACGDEPGPCHPSQLPAPAAG
jgi:hypothetical protein